MKYYSEETVKKIIAHAEYNGTFCIQEPIHLGTYSSIELPDKYGRLIDADALADKPTRDILTTGDDYADLWRAIHTAPTILEANHGSDS